MKRKYESPVIRIVLIAPKGSLLTPGSIQGIQGNVGLKLGKGSTKDARARESELWIDDDN